MKKEPKLYSVEGSGDNTGYESLAPGEFESALGKWICPRCHAVLPGCGPIDIRIQDDGPIPKPLAILANAWLGLVWLQFLEPLGLEVVASELHLGKVIWEDGRVAMGWSTFHGRHRVIVRGSHKDLSYRRCQACQRKTYLSLGPYYLCPAPPAEHRILTTDTGFVLRPEQFAALTIRGWRKNLCITPLDIPEYPNDRLPIDLVDPS